MRKESGAGSVACCATGAVALLIGCTAHLNRDPNILSQPPFDQLTYVARPDDGFEEVTLVQVTTRGLEANLLNTMPALYRKALKEHALDPRTRFLTGIQVSSFVQREPFQVPYQDCRTEYYSESVPHQNCTGGYGTYSTRTCTTQYSMQQRSRQKCDTKYRTEIRNVLYQKATAMLLRRK